MNFPQFDAVDKLLLDFDKATIPEKRQILNKLDIYNDFYINLLNDNENIIDDYHKILLSLLPKMQKYWKLKEEFNKEYAKIPDKYVVEINNLIQRLEDETNKKYMFNISVFGTGQDYDIEMGSFKERKTKVIVQDVVDRYNNLIGEYDSFAILKTKIDQLYQDDYKKPKIDMKSGLIYTTNGGRMSICHPIGKLSFL